MLSYDITPVPAPRMTRSDRWKKRPCVLRYFAFRDEVKAHKISVEPFGAHVKFYMPMPNRTSPGALPEALNSAKAFLMPIAERKASAA